MNDDKIKYAEKIVAVCIIGCLAVFCLFCIYNYLSTDKSADNHNDNITVQRIEDEHRQLGDELADIRTELQYGQKAVTRAEERIGDLQESNAVSTEKLRESRELIKRSRDIFKDVDRANGLPEAQTDSEGTTK
jgi:CHASE3 domain sensor protein